MNYPKIKLIKSNIVNLEGKIKGIFERSFCVVTKSLLENKLLSGFCPYKIFRFVTLYYRIIYVNLLFKTDLEYYAFNLCLFPFSVVLATEFKRNFLKSLNRLTTSIFL